jgi:multiple sugar transport system ATP-binding protein
VSHAEHLGSDTMVYVEAPGLGLLTVRADGDATHQVGDIVSMAPAEGKVHRFDGEGRATG